MVSTDEARALALDLPDTCEQDHHGRPSFRVSGRIFATLWTDRAMNVMAGFEPIRAAVESDPETCREFFWGKRLAAVQVDLDRADGDLVGDLLDHAWRAKASASLRRRSESGGVGRPDG
jgi:hypothetical protein